VNNKHSDKYNFQADADLYPWCDEVADVMSTMFGISQAEAAEKISEYWHGLDLRGGSDVHLHEPHSFWARVFYYKGNPPGDPREPWKPSRVS
jgi:hypothetical protein